MVHQPKLTALCVLAFLRFQNDKRNNNYTLRVTILVFGVSRTASADHKESKSHTFLFAPSFRSHLVLNGWHKFETTKTWQCRISTLTCSRQPSILYHDHCQPNYSAKMGVIINFLSSLNEVVHTENMYTLIILSLTIYTRFTQAL